MPTTDTQLQQFIVNIGTTAQIEAAIQGGTITSDMLSITTDGPAYAVEPSIVDLEATDSITLADNTIYNGGTQTALTITVINNPTLKFLCEIVFTSGSSPTTLSYSNTIKWFGDDVSSNIFAPVANKRYTIICSYDGVEWMFVVKGVE